MQTTENPFSARNVSSFIHNPYGSRGLFLIREMANFCFFFFCSLKKKTGKTTTTNKSAHAKAPKLSRCADVIQLCHRTSTMCQSPNSGQQFLPTELVFTLSRSLSAVRIQNDPGLEITLARVSSSSLLNGVVSNCGSSHNFRVQSAMDGLSWLVMITCC